MGSKVLPIWLYALLSFMAFSNRAWPTDNEVVQAQAVKDAAASYLRSMPARTKVYVWPTWRRPYEIIGDNLNVRSSVERYKALRGDLSGLSPAFRIAQISILTAGPNWQKDVESALAGSRLLPWYKDFAAKAKAGKDGCTAYKFLSRGAWASAGIILINGVNFQSKGAGELDRCVHAGLDYLQGFPTRDRYFDYLAIPDTTIRGAVIEAIYKCAAEADGSGEQRERTKDGLTPLPSLDCIVAKVAEKD